MSKVPRTFSRRDFLKISGAVGLLGATGCAQPVFAPTMPPSEVKPSTQIKPEISPQTSPTPTPEIYSLPHQSRTEIVKDIKALTNVATKNINPSFYDAEMLERLTELNDTEIVKYWSLWTEKTSDTIIWTVNLKPGSGEGKFQAGIKITYGGLGDPYIGVREFMIVSNLVNPNVPELSSFIDPSDKEKLAADPKNLINAYQAFFTVPETLSWRQLKEQGTDKVAAVVGKFGTSDALDRVVQAQIRTDGYAELNVVYSPFLPTAK